MIRLQNAERDHLSNLSRIVQAHRNMITQLQTGFTLHTEAMTKTFQAEREKLNDLHALTVREMTALSQAVELEDNERINSGKQAHETEREELRNKNLESINELRVSLEHKIEELERAFDDAHRVYLDSTALASQHFVQLKQEDARLALLISEKKKSISKLSTLLAHAKAKLQHAAITGAERNQALKRQHSHIAAHCAMLKNSMCNFRNKAQHQLIENSERSKIAIDKARQQISAVEKILAAAQLTRKLETEREKVWPPDFTHQKETPLLVPVQVCCATFQCFLLSMCFPHLSSHLFFLLFSVLLFLFSVQTAWADESQNESSATKSSDEVKLKAQFGSSVPLTRFYAKYNKVLLDTLGIKSEKNRLMQENQELRLLLRQYLDGIAITPNSLQQDNPLLIINGKLSLLTPSAPSRTSTAPHSVPLQETVKAAVPAYQYVTTGSKT